MLCVANKVLTGKKASLAVVSAWLVLLGQLPVFAVQDVVISWNPSEVSAVAGYKIYYGLSSGNYVNVVDAGSATNVTITSLVEGASFYFAAKTYDAFNNESVLSDEVVGYVPPSVVTVTNDPGVVTNSPAGGDTNGSSTTNNPTPPNPQPGLNQVRNVVLTPKAGDSTSVTISWEASSDEGVIGYQICKGLSSGSYPSFVNVGLVTNCVINGLVPGTTNYFAMNEFDNTWTKSQGSVELVWYVPLTENQAPTLNIISSRNINMNDGVQSVALTGISAGASDAGQSLTVQAVSSNTKLIANVLVNYTSPNSIGVLTFKPVANATGRATISVTVSDSGTGSNFVTQVFTVTVVNPAILAAMPKIVKQVASTGALPGKTVTLGVTVSGRAPFKYQWRFNGKNLPGATGAALTLKGLKASNAGAYSVQVSNNAGMTNSATAQLTVFTNPAPNISKAAKTVNGHFAFEVDGVPGAKYVVQASSDLKTWTPIHTNTAPFSFTDSNSTSFNQRYYRSFYKP